MDMKIILLVEDDAIIALTEKMSLETYGYSVVTVSSGEKALKTMKERADIDLILMDIDLGTGIDGTEAAEHILADFDIPILFLSSHTERDVVEKTEGISTYGYVVKNSGITVLDAAIKMAFRLYEAKIREAEKEKELLESNKIMDQFFSESTAGSFFMVMDNPVEWNDSVDKEAVMDYVFENQKMTKINRAMLQQYGAKKEEFIGKTPNELFAHDIAYGRSLWQKMFDQGHLYIDTDERRFDGSRLWIIGNYCCMYDEKGRITGHFGTQYDITDQKNAEGALGENEILLTEAQKLAHVGNWEYDIASERVFGSHEGFRIYGLHPPDSGLMPLREIEACIPESQRVHQALVDLIEKEVPYDLEFDIHPADGSEARSIISRAVLIKDSSGNPIKVRGVIQDITKRKVIEQEIRRQLTEKETLLKEVHHRIKNNLATVESLLNLQIQATDHDAPVAVLKDAAGRVSGMRKIYDHLLSGSDYRSLSVKTYLNDVIDNNMALFPHQGEITIKKEIEEFDLGSRFLFPLGVITTELLTNIMKYAFPVGKAGQITVTLKKKGTMAYLSVQDNGKGFPSDIDLQHPQSLGLMLVQLLSEQIEGTFEIESGKGCLATLSFKLP
jgi:PAS domain S-box-containing protein